MFDLASTSRVSRRSMLLAGAATLFATGATQSAMASEDDHSRDIDVHGLFAIHLDDTPVDPIESININIKHNPYNDEHVTYPDYLFETSVDIQPIYMDGERPESLGWGWWPVEHCYVTAYRYEKTRIYPEFEGYIVTLDGERIDGSFIVGDVLQSNLKHDGRPCYTHSTYYVEWEGLDYHWYVLADDGSEIPIR